jgi:hypothetical protein
MAQIFRKVTEGFIVRGRHIIRGFGIFAACLLVMDLVGLGIQRSIASPPVVTARRATAVRTRDPAESAACLSLTRNLARLRAEYDNYVKTTKETKFEELTKILDKIIKLKGEMRGSRCKIPPRTEGVRALPE